MRKLDSVLEHCMPMPYSWCTYIGDNTSWFGSILDEKKKSAHERLWRRQWLWRHRCNHAAIDGRIRLAAAAEADQLPPSGVVPNCVQCCLARFLLLLLLDSTSELLAIVSSISILRPLGFFSLLVLFSVSFSLFIFSLYCCSFCWVRFLVRCFHLTVLYSAGQLRSWRVSKNTS